MSNQLYQWVIDIGHKIFRLRLLIDYSMIFANNQWLIDWLLIDYHQKFKEIGEALLEFPQGWGGLRKIPSVGGGYEYFLELHINLVMF